MRAIKSSSVPRSWMLKLKMQLQNAVSEVKEDLLDCGTNSSDWDALIGHKNRMCGNVGPLKVT